MRIPCKTASRKIRTTRALVAVTNVSTAATLPQQAGGATKGIEIPQFEPDAVCLPVLSLPQTLIAERTSYERIDGNVMTDGNERKVGDPNPGGAGQNWRPAQPLLYKQLFELSSRVPS